MHAPLTPVRSEAKRFFKSHDHLTERWACTKQAHPTSWASHLQRVGTVRLLVLRLTACRQPDAFPCAAPCGWTRARAVRGRGTSRSGRRRTAFSGCCSRTAALGGCDGRAATPGASTRTSSATARAGMNRCCCEFENKQSCQVAEKLRRFLQKNKS